MHKGHKFAIQGSGCINADIIIFKISHYPKNGQILTGGKRMTFLKANKIYFQFQSVADELKKICLLQAVVNLLSIAVKAVSHLSLVAIPHFIIAFSNGGFHSLSSGR